PRRVQARALDAATRTEGTNGTAIRAPAQRNPGSQGAQADADHGARYSMNAHAKPPRRRAQRRCLAAATIIVIAGLAGCGKSSSSPEQEARAYISSKGHTVNTAKVEVEHVATLVALSEIGQAAQKAHNDIDGFRQELFDRKASEKLKHATLQLSEGANELNNA